jgi:hypothetical protein
MFDFKDALIHEQIYLIKNASKVGFSSNTVSDFSHTGNWESSLYVLFQTEGNALPDEVKAMLDKLLQVLPFTDPAPLRLPLQGIILSEIQPKIIEFRPSFIFLHQANHNQPATQEFCQVAENAGTTVIKAPTLETIHRDLQAKKSFWEHVQKSLNLSK